MMRSPAFLFLVVMLGVSLSFTNATIQRGDRAGFNTRVGTPLEGLASSLYRRGSLAPVYAFLRQNGLSDAMAKSIVVMVFASMAVALSVAVDYAVHLLTTSSERRELPELGRLGPERIAAVVDFIEGAAALWE